ncbi:Hypothetical predicted protein [Lecanosticta acicola]|uniref:EthD domain-containing protein n=1 Tax=Lecanosticta acicola TaxID=111012 RepID=A0AAI9EAB3_9PEZI|nr:Hypothetical predicted protein [Lecanosticta acicola]
MAVDSSSKPQPQPLLCWTVCGYRKPGMSEEDYHRTHPSRYLSENHGPLVRGLLAKHGFVSYTIRHNTTSTRSLMAHIFGPQFANIADYDAVITATFRDIESWVAFKGDPEYKVKIMPDHENFADTARSRMTIGWLEDHVWNGRVVDAPGKGQDKSRGEVENEWAENESKVAREKESAGWLSWLSWWRRFVI